MRRVIATLFFVLLAGCCSATPPARALSRPDVAAGLVSKTVAVLISGPGGMAVCSGVWVTDTAILTADHCVDEEAIGDDVGYGIDADLREDTFTKLRLATVEKHDADHDLALLRTANAPAHMTAHLSAATLGPGLHVQTMGHPRHMWWSYSSGDVAAVRKVDFGLDMLWIQATAPISPGNSGGGLFDDDGDLLGICSRGSGGDRAQMLNFWVHRTYLVDFLRGVK